VFYVKTPDRQNQGESVGGYFMHPFNKSIKDITLEDIETLIQDQVPEGRTLDYKRDLYTGNDKGKKDFLIDVSALANTVGGYLIIGMEESEGVPKSIVGVEIPEFDKLKLDFENLLRMSVDPPIRGVEFQAIDVANNRKVLIIEVPRSISRPHAVTIQKYHRFHGRHSSGTYPFEVNDIRRAILESETIAIKIRNFRNDRLSLISINNAPLPLCSGGKFVLHLIPASAFDLTTKIQFEHNSQYDFPPIGSSGWNHRLNFDGYLTYEQGHENNYVTSYTQIFNNGIIEAVEGSMLQDQSDRKKTIPSGVFEKKIIESTNQYISSLQKCGITPPIWLCLSLLGVQNYVMALPQSYYDDVVCIDRNDLIVPEILINDFKIKTERILKPAFDSVWNACGLAGSINYDKEGNWKPR
jgi:hypothetical protein